MLFNPLTTIAYFRVSTIAQAEEYHSIDNYTDRFIRAGFTSDRILYDIGSGGDRSRTQYQNILNQIKNGKIDTVVIPELSRLSRDIGHFQEVIEVFKSSGAKLLTLDGHQFDFDSPDGSLNTNLQVLFAEHTRKLNQYRSIKGHEFLRRQGRAIRPTFPYLKDGDHLIPNTNLYRGSNLTVWSVGREVIETFLQKKNISQTITHLVQKYGSKQGYWGEFPRETSALRDWLKLETIRGNLKYKDGTILYSTHESLISLEESKAIAAILSLNTRKKKVTTEIRNLFLGIIYCHCGSEMKVNNSRGIQYLVCKAAYPQSAKNRVLTTRCLYKSSYGLTVDKVEDIVLTAISNRSKEIADNYLTGNLPDNPEIVLLNQQIDTYSRMVIADPDLEEILKMKIQKRDKLVAISRDSGDEYLMGMREKLKDYGRNIEFWKQASKEDRVLIYREVVKKITCHQGQVSVELFV